MTTKAVTSDEIKLANEIVASCWADSAAALKNAKDVARQSGVPFKFDIEGLVVAFDPDKEEAELEADRLQKEAEEEARHVLKKRVKPFQNCIDDITNVFRLLMKWKRF